jgi:hypothetical protein
MEGEYAAAMSKARIGYVENAAKLLKPQVTKGQLKADGLIQDIKTYAANPTKENFFRMFSGDANARGFATQLKLMDQTLVEFPEIRDKVWPSSYKLMDMLPGLAPYAAECSADVFETRFNQKMGLDGNNPDTWKVHARLLLKQAPNVQKFALDCTKLLKLL